MKNSTSYLETNKGVGIIKVKFRFDIGDIHKTATRDIQSTATDGDIKSMFLIVLGIEYRDFCSYEILEEGD